MYMCFDEKEAALHILSQDPVLLKRAVVGNCCLQSIKARLTLYYRYRAQAAPRAFECLVWLGDRIPLTL